MALSTHSPDPVPAAVPLASRRPDHGARALSMAHHPTARPARSATASFSDTVQLLTGSWRVDDPSAFARALTEAPVIAGHPVLDLAEAGEYSPDPWSIRTWASVRAVLAGLAERRTLRVARVSAEQAGRRITEARGLAPSSSAEVACFVLAHLVDEAAAPRRFGRSADPSWIVAVIGDASGGVAAVARARLATRVTPALREPLTRLRHVLTQDEGDNAVVVPFPTPQPMV